MRFSYSLQNLRRLKSTPTIQIRPITILLGKNSVGKSTFLRSFPLLRQSIETKSSAPILWYGSYVDFGDFRSAVSNKDLDRKIGFNFELENYTARLRAKSPLSLRFNAEAYSGRSYSVDRLRIEYKVGHTSGGTARSSISLEVPSLESKLDLDFATLGTFVSSAKVNGMDLTELLNSFVIYVTHGSLFDEPHFLEKAKENKSTKLIGASRSKAFLHLVEKKLGAFVDGRTSNKRILSEAFRVLKHDTLNSDSLEALSRAETETFRRLYMGMLSGRMPELLKYLDTLCRANYLFDLLHVVGESLHNFYSSVEYINPARARSERFYRLQELEVSEISPDGKNLPMFLASLSRDQMQDFSDWVKSTFGYGVKVHRTEGHISINLEQRGQSVNVVDTGYGVSQVLPVLAQVWWMKFSHRRRDFGLVKNNVGIKTLVIEQPELHLHPAHQALLADVFVEAQQFSNNRSGASQYYIIETHSEALVNRLGELIEAGKIGSEDVQIVIFGDVGDDLDESDVSVANFDSAGVLQNWPYGFFNFA